MEAVQTNISMLTLVRNYVKEMDSGFKDGLIVDQIMGGQHG